MPRQYVRGYFRRSRSSSGGCMVGVLAILMGIGFIGFLISTYPVQSLLLVGIAVAIVAWLLVLRNSARKKQVTELQMPPILLRPRVSRTCYIFDSGRTY